MGLWIKESLLGPSVGLGCAPATCSKVDHILGKSLYPLAGCMGLSSNTEQA